MLICGSSLVRAPVDYHNWDADKIQGCVCDPGFEGYDCSLRSCPAGPDPSIDTASQYTVERFLLQCQATSGYFSMLVLGRHTAPIPFDADPAYLRAVLEANPAAGDVSVTMPVVDSDRLPSVCGESEVVTTEIRFTSHLGDRAPVRVSRNSSDSRQWRDGAQQLALATAASPVLRMETLHVLQCPVCVSCLGSVHFTYLDSVSVGVDINASGAADSIVAAVLGLHDLVAAGWSDLEVLVAISAGGDTICNSVTSTTVEISLFSAYGNLPSLGVLDGSYFSPSDSTALDLTLSSNKGSGTIYECSNQGVCNHDTGVCECFLSVAYGEVQFRALSSNGQFELGNRGDCGFIENAVPSCFVAGKDVCNGHGSCSNVTHTCECTSGWHGITCGLRSCPLVRLAGRNSGVHSSVV